MIYTPMTKRALALCFEAHKDQLDKSGLPYVFHPFHLAEQMTDEVTTTVALLHDVVEDSDITLEALTEMGFPDAVTKAIALLTHDSAVPYMDYVAKIKENPLQKPSSSPIFGIIAICHALTPSPPMTRSGQRSIKTQSNCWKRPTKYK